jgi:hypothetical protein
MQIVNNKLNRIIVFFILYLFLVKHINLIVLQGAIKSKKMKLYNFFGVLFELKQKNPTNIVCKLEINITILNKL